MGYTTDFYGDLTIDPPLDALQVAYLQAFSDTRRMKRDPIKAADIKDELREAVGLSVFEAPDAGYFVAGAGYAGQDKDISVLDNNCPPSGQPGLWCGWTVTAEGTCLEWDGGEKFYDYVEWLHYLIDNFYTRWGRKLNGTIEWFGEDRTDFGKIVVVDNQIEILNGHLVYDQPMRRKKHGA